MKIVVLSDTHLQEVTPGLEALCERYAEGADLVVHCGDLVSFAVLDYLSRWPLEAVSGNSDHQTVRERLPGTRVIRAAGRRIGVAHGWGSPQDIRGRLSREFPGCEAVLFGHTHTPLCEREGGVLWVNPGSPCAPRGEGGPTLARLAVDGAALSAHIVHLSEEC